jgi:hypothetical protein
VSEEFGEVVNKNRLNFNQRLFLRFGQQFQIAQTIRSRLGQPELVRETCLAISANQPMTISKKQLAVFE